MFKYGVIYREAIKTPLIDWCALMTAPSSLRLISQIIKLVQDNAPELTHECPYNASVLFLNVEETSTTGDIYFRDSMYATEQ